jgi:hypothetical protein
VPSPLQTRVGVSEHSTVIDRMEAGFGVPDALRDAISMASQITLNPLR